MANGYIETYEELTPEIKAQAETIIKRIFDNRMTEDNMIKPLKLSTNIVFDIIREIISEPEYSYVVPNGYALTYSGSVFMQYGIKWCTGIKDIQYQEIISDILNIRRGLVVPSKIYRAVNGQLVEIKTIYRCKNGECVKVWDITKKE